MDRNGLAVRYEEKNTPYISFHRVLGLFCMSSASAAGGFLFVLLNIPRAFGRWRQEKFYNTLSSAACFNILKLLRVELNQPI